MSEIDLSLLSVAGIGVSQRSKYQPRYLDDDDNTSSDPKSEHLRYLDDDGNTSSDPKSEHLRYLDDDDDNTSSDPKSEHVSIFSIH